MEDDTLALERVDVPLAVLYRDHRVALVRLAVLLLGDQGAAEDVVQDVFASVVRRGERVTVPYMRVAVVNRSRSALRSWIVRRRRVVPGDAAVPGPAERVELAAEHQEVMRAVARLPARQREVLVLRYYGELSVAEVAQTLGIREGTVKSTAARGLERLRGLLDGEA